MQLQSSGEGILVTSPKGENFKYVLQMHFLESNNVAEYEALLHGLQIAMTLSIRWLKIFGNSLLVINQANKEWSCLDEKMMAYCHEIHKLEKNFNKLNHHIRRGWNEVVDELAKLSQLHETSISTTLSKANRGAKSVDHTVMSVDDKPDSSNIMLVDSNWRTPFMTYLKIGGLQEDKVEKERLRQRAVHYTLVGEELFR
jgi:ribonuclease HI